MHRIARLGITLLLAACGLAVGQADEGMWTFDNFPSTQVEEQYGFLPSREWLDRVRLASARIAGGCSASFVSPDGLAMTNHHCVEECVQDLSTSDTNYTASGFVAASRADELRCPGYEINQLLRTEDVTAEVTEALRGKTGAAFVEARRAVKSRLEQACRQGKADTRCDLVTLYGGGLYHLYRYHRWDDVRLVFAPEMSVAFFGGDPDNFNFPRYDLDVAFLRVYEEGRPAATSDFFHWSSDGAREGQLVFVSGNPGNTSRLDTAAQLGLQREQILPDRIVYLSELRGMLTEFRNRGTEQRRIAADQLFGVENSLKVLRGRLSSLSDGSVWALKLGEEEELRRRVASDPTLQSSYGDAWEAIAAAMAAYREIADAHRMVEVGDGFRSELFDHARTLVRAAEERGKPSGKRLPEFADAKLPQVEHALFAPAPVYPELEIATLTFSLTKLREELGADDPFVRFLFGARSPREIAEEAVRGSGLADPQARRALYEGGAGAIEASPDAMIRLARKLDPEARAVRKKFEDDVDSVVEINGEKIARARFAIHGTRVYPDATFTARLSFGAVQGWVERGRPVEPFTTFRGLFERHTGREPFDLPPRWLEARDGLALDTPLNFVTTNDIIGGNSGSPVIDREARVVGLVFDGNIHSLGGDFWFDPTRNRTVAVASQAILEALDNVYGAQALAGEIRQAAASP